MSVAVTYSIAEVAASFNCSPRWLTEQVRAGRFPAKKICKRWRMTDQDIADALDICANDFHCPTTDVAIASGLTPRSRKKVAGLRLSATPYPDV